uniref:O-methyltransferase like n=1 Tax=Nigella sativa TaxID=555479 RepID=A0A899GZZ3_NIGSA|nr:O-methyltransferase like [Nigella sativa]
MKMEMMNENGAKDLLEAQANVWKYTYNYVTGMSLRCALELGIPDIIASHDKPLTLSELVKALPIPVTKSPHIYRLMRILVHMGFFAVQKDVEDKECYTLTPSSKILLKTNKKGLSPLPQMATDPLIVTTCSRLSSWFLSSTDSTPFEIANGVDFWSYHRQHLDSGKLFNEAMAGDTKFVSDMVVKELQPMLEGSESLVDVGGGTGTMARAISNALPSIKCTVYDLTQVVSNMQETHNLEFVSGDMFHYVPSADVILLKWILHDWSDQECVKILKQCRDAISKKEKGGKVIIIDIVIDNKIGAHDHIETQLCLDMIMMVLFNGKERTEREWEKLFLDAGFTSYKITHTLGLRSFIEIFP